MSADYTRTFWSQGEIHNFLVLPRAAPNPAVVIPRLPYPTLDPTQAQHDTAQIRGGIEFVFILGGLKWPVRAGAFDDRQYAQASDGTAPHFLGVTVNAVRRTDQGVRRFEPPLPR